MRTVAALAAIVTLLLCAPLLLAGPGATTVPAAMAQPARSDAGGLRLTLDELAPRVVTADGPGTLNVSGTLTNTGTEPVDELAVRVQRGDPVRSEAEVRDALAGRSSADAVTPEFTELPGELAPGASLPVRLSVPLTGPGQTSLALQQTGVHPVLVNVNGARDGVRARLAAVRLLLPVLALPEAGGANPAPNPRPTPFTLLYPITEEPHRLPTVPGETTTLTADLAPELAPGGRLAGLVDALDARAPVGSAVRAGVCVAVDPDLVETAAQMANGYQVRAPDGTLTPGTGAEDARAWLARLSAALRGSCVIALPFSDADLVALVRSGGADLATRAVDDGRRITADLLGTPVLADTLWPSDGVLDEPTLATLAAAGGDGAPTVVLSAEGLDQPSGRVVSGVVPVADGTSGPAAKAVLTDPLLTLAAAGPGDSADGRATAGIGVVTSSSLAGSGPLGSQDAIGALAFRALSGRARTAGTAPLVLAPPHQWRLDGESASELLGATARLVGQELLGPRALGATVAAGPGPGTPARRLVYPVQAGAAEIPGTVVRSLDDFRDDVERLRAAAEYEPGVGAPLAAVFDPLLRGTLRAASGAWRGSGETVPRQQADLVGARIAELVGSVRVLEPPGPFSLGTRDAPLPLTIANGLPVTMTVRVEMASSSGLRVAPIPVQRVPPLGRVQLRASAEVLRAGRFTVEATVRTPDGGMLGEPTRLQVRSTVYGTVTVWLTGVAGVLLVLLAARRVYRRIRFGEGRPPGPPTASPRSTPPPPGPTAPTPAVPPVPDAPGTPGVREAADPAVTPDSTGRPGPPGPRAGDAGPPPAPFPRRVHRDGASEWARADHPVLAASPRDPDGHPDRTPPPSRSAPPAP